MGIPEEKILVFEDAVELNKYDSIKKSKTELKKLLNMPTNKKIIMYTGSIIEGRGIDTILDAANILEDRNLIFYIIGGYSKDIKKWKYYKKRKKIEANVKFLGFIENRKIHLYHKAADILLAPYSTKCSTVDWMSPIKIFEYTASKVPIIASDVKRIKEICNNHECLFFNNDDPYECLFFNNDDPYKLTRLASKRSLKSKDVLKIQFEDLILHYDETVKIICDFLGEEKFIHVDMKKHLIPENSKKNIGLWKNFENKKIIKKIHDELREYCWD